jgi:hypothetical protein
MTNLKLIVVEESGEREIQFSVRRVVNAGYTGRNQEAVRRHIEELKKKEFRLQNRSRAFTRSFRNWFISMTK